MFLLIAYVSKYCLSNLDNEKVLEIIKKYEDSISETRKIYSSKSG